MGCITHHLLKFVNIMALQGYTQQIWGNMRLIQCCINSRKIRCEDNHKL